jgi:DNA-binding response OmpR family regulator
MATFCLNCGYNISKDETVERDGWVLMPGKATHRAAHIDISMGQADILHALADAYPATVSGDALANRSSRGRYSTNSLKSTIFLIRKKLGPLSPIETVRGEGYCWRTPSTGKR